MKSKLSLLSAAFAAATFAALPALAQNAPTAPVESGKARSRPRAASPGLDREQDPRLDRQQGQVRQRQEGGEGKGRAAQDARADRAAPGRRQGQDRRHHRRRRGRHQQVSHRSRLLLQAGLRVGRGSCRAPPFALVGQGKGRAYIGRDARRRFHQDARARQRLRRARCARRMRWRSTRRRRARIADRHAASAATSSS